MGGGTVLLTGQWVITAVSIALGLLRLKCKMSRNIDSSLSLYRVF